jgi:hypothetical protein
MNRFEKDAKKMHGDGGYSITWSARKNQNKKHLWFVLGATTIFQIIWKSVVAFVLLWFINFFFTWKAGVTKDFLVSFLTLLSMSPVIEALVDPKVGVRNASNCIAIASDMNRIRKGNYGILLKIVSVPMMLFFGTLAAYSGYSVWLRVGKNMSVLTTSELDVLGTSLSRGVIFWVEAYKVFLEICIRYEKSKIRGGDEEVSCAGSYGLACKWRMVCHRTTEDEKAHFKREILGVLSKYPSLPEEITMRLHEALTM